jgi:hypothetical protein
LRYSVITHTRLQLFPHTCIAPAPSFASGTGKKNRISEKITRAIVSERMVGVHLLSQSLTVIRLVVPPVSVSGDYLSYSVNTVHGYPGFPGTVYGLHIYLHSIRASLIPPYGKKYSGRLIRAMIRIRTTVNKCKIMIGAHRSNQSSTLISELSYPDHSCSSVSLS